MKVCLFILFLVGLGAITSAIVWFCVNLVLAPWGFPEFTYLQSVASCVLAAIWHALGSKSG